ncbi:MAG TPA: efflux transporter outer membrane subunit [Planctomycetota bacterium]|nr:efflux transporter outer membrane subunit [Planctomycetota bacterium]
MRRALPILLLALAGCGPGGAPRAPQPTAPAAWTSTAQAGAVDDGWIASLGDEALPALVDEALAANRDLAQATARLDAALARAVIAGAELAPALSGTAQAERSRRNLGTGFGSIFGGDDDEPLVSYGTTYGVGLQISWELDVWGRLRRGREAATHDAEAALADLAAARLSIAGQLAKAWFAAGAAQRQAALQSTLVDELKAARQIADERYRAGLIDAERVRELSTAQARANDVLSRSRRRAGEAARQVELLLGRVPGSGLAATALPEPLAPIAAGIPAEAIARRPDVHAAERRMRAADRRVAAARANLYPRLSLTASGGTSSSDLAELLDGDFRIWSIGGNLLQPIWQGGALRANVVLSDAESRVAYEGFAIATLRALAEIEDALAAQVHLAERAAAQDAVLGEAAELSRSADERFAGGSGDALAALSARRGALEAESEAVAARLDRVIGRIDLHLALAGEPLASKEKP